MPPLHRAIALAEVDGVAVTITKHLDFDMAGIDDRALQDHGAVAERALRLRSRAAQGVGKSAHIPDQPHAAPTAAGDGFYHDRKACLFGLCQHHGVALVRPLIAGYAGHAGGLHDRFRTGLVAHCLDGVGRRTDEHQARVTAGSRERFVLGEKTVTGMDRIGADCLRSRDDRINPQVRLGRQCLADADGLVRLAHMQRLAVGVGIDRDHAIAEAARGPRDPPRDLATIGDQYLVKHGRLHRPISHGRATENCMRWGLRASASRQIASTSLKTLRVSRGSITPSSSTRALVENTSIWPSNTPMISAFIASSFAFSIGLPRRAAAASATIAMVSAACSPPITAVLAFGHEKQKQKRE